MEYVPELAVGIIAAAIGIAFGGAVCYKEIHRLNETLRVMHAREDQCENQIKVLQKELNLALEGWQAEQAKATEAERRFALISEALPLIGHPAAQRGFVPMGAFHMQDGDEHAPHEAVDGQVPQ